MVIERKHTADLIPADYNPRKDEILAHSHIGALDGVAGGGMLGEEAVLGDGLLALNPPGHTHGIPLQKLRRHQRGTLALGQRHSRITVEMGDRWPQNKEYTY